MRQVGCRLPSLLGASWTHPNSTFWNDPPKSLLPTLNSLAVESCPSAPTPIPKHGWTGNLHSTITILSLQPCPVCLIQSKKKPNKHCVSLASLWKLFKTSGPPCSPVREALTARVSLFSIVCMESNSRNGVPNEGGSSQGDWKDEDAVTSELQSLSSSFSGSPCMHSGSGTCDPPSETSTAQFSLQPYPPSIIHP